MKAGKEKGRLRDRVARAVGEEVDILPYDPVWPRLFQEEKQHLLACLPRGLVRRVEHFGSTAVPGLPAKPVIDMLVEVSDLNETRVRIVPILENQGYDYFWRPTRGEDIPPFYAWFIKRRQDGIRTHHIHMVEHHFEHWDRLVFRDYLIEFPEVAGEYATLKLSLSQRYRGDRVAYTNGKTDFVVRVTEAAKEWLKKTGGKR